MVIKHKNAPLIFFPNNTYTSSPLYLEFSIFQVHVLTWIYMDLLGKQIRVHSM